ncbi:hypothetical protein VMT65_27825 [Nocardia sp. CDC153]|uniref:hypothetical protein n=1 Tax=Nocardia sp. CDC153 TaxID=3112167 RepID=UPI002DB6782F|nr:hypothetical protein [Nocardia sp. CDC153]MEC3956876.1 hypothetical protein [Nocardia sp. CDC153]
MSPQTRLAQDLGRRRVRRPVSPTVADPERALRNYRAQRRRAIPVLGLLALLLIGIPVAITVFPALDEVRVADVPVSWVMLWLLPYPAFSMLGGWHLRRAEAVETTRGAGEHRGTGEYRHTGEHSGGHADRDG